MTGQIVARAAAAALTFGMLFGPIAAAEALECPQAQPLSKPGVIKETPAEIAELGPALSGGDIVAKVPELVAALKTRYPAAGSAEIANYLITAYCPGVEKTTGLSDAQKTARVEAFSKAVLGVLY